MLKYEIKNICFIGPEKTTKVIIETGAGLIGKILLK